MWVCLCLSVCECVCVCDSVWCGRTKVHVYVVYVSQVEELKGQLKEREGEVSRARRATHAANLEKQQVRTGQPLSLSLLLPSTLSLPPSLFLPPARSGAGGAEE